MIERHNKDRGSGSPQTPDDGNGRFMDPDGWVTASGRILRRSASKVAAWGKHGGFGSNRVQQIGLSRAAIGTFNHLLRSKVES